MEDNTAPSPGNTQSHLPTQPTLQAFNLLRFPALLEAADCRHGRENSGPRTGPTGSFGTPQRVRRHHLTQAAHLLLKGEAEH